MAAAAVQHGDAGPAAIDELDQGGGQERALIEG